MTYDSAAGLRRAFEEEALEELDQPLEHLLPSSRSRGRDRFAIYEKSLGIRTAYDLLMHVPRRYAKRGELTAITDLPIGEHVTFVGRVAWANTLTGRASGKQYTTFTIEDGEGHQVYAVFFGRPGPYWASQFPRGSLALFSGVAKVRGQRVELAHPEIARVPDAAEGWSAMHDRIAQEFAQELIPIYSAANGLQSTVIRTDVETLLDLIPEIPDPVPAETRRAVHSLSLDEAVRRLHDLSSKHEIPQCRSALSFTEAFLLQTVFVGRRMAARRDEATRRRADDAGFLDAFDARLPFELTGDQLAVGADIARELASDVPMHRLVQGEVGSGKTLVATRAMLQVADADGQSVLLAPTEVLAAQHARSIAESLGPDLSARLMPTLLTGSMPAKDRRAALARIASGDARIVIATHAVLGDKVAFHDLGLVVIDEQHRFGVEQRDALRAKATHPPHVLVLTATPIPRTVAMTVFGDLDVSTIAELPQGRAGIETHVVGLGEHPKWIERVWGRLAEEVAEGRQAFVVCPAIVAGEVEPDFEDDAPKRGKGRSTGAKTGAKASRTTQEALAAPGEDAPLVASVEATLELMRERPDLRGLRIEAVHGRLPSDEKDARMRAFERGEIDILVATTVIEVGVNVPNASAMVILDADRFGVSQLHQLRGRVGRGSHAGLCLLVTRALPETPSRDRVNAVASTLDGFALAEIDLEQRREGDVLGARQSGGRSSLRFLRVVENAELIETARMQATELLEADPRLAEHRGLIAALRRFDPEALAFMAKG